MTWLILKGILLFLVLSYAAYRDIKTREIPDAVPLMLLLTGFIGFSPLFSITGLLVAGLPFLWAALWCGGMGGGDIKLMATCGFVLGAWGGILQTILGLALALLFTMIRAAAAGKKIERKLKIPLIPFLGAGGILAFLITFWGG
ncbi:prepilin peptidase [Desulfosporosinus lacus]|uniref:Leader peptidase (Prepilin peptidase) / N-methyltransferase n=1 Tax=Desulfosporosinus lacus DSM 15449 TaxID=1121420 RepID=A0A1M5V336_9FIRM|nr:A24 family peptidase [Desulfosporosinus lacus]SHH69373.1 leader peptidase (prepilin peptidase) / N-methyltransferase [Desulfosporosinus lacus DSM 15449]